MREGSEGFPYFAYMPLNERERAHRGFLISPTCPCLNTPHTCTRTTHIHMPLEELRYSVCGMGSLREVMHAYHKRERLYYRLRRSNMTYETKNITFHVTERGRLFQFLCYLGLQYNWNMRNAFMFDNRHGVEAYVKKLKGILTWNFWMLEHVGIISCIFRFFNGITWRCSPYIGIW